MQGMFLVVSGTNVSSGTHMTWFLSLEAWLDWVFVISCWITNNPKLKDWKQQYLLSSSFCGSLMGWFGPGAQDLLTSHQGLSQGHSYSRLPRAESSSKSVQSAGFSWSMAVGQPLSVPDHVDPSASHNVAAGSSEWAARWAKEKEWARRNSPFQVKIRSDSPSFLTLFF